MNSNQDNRYKTYSDPASNGFIFLVAAFPVLLAALLSTVIHASIPFDYIDSDTPYAAISHPPHQSHVQGSYTAIGTIKKSQPDNRKLYIVEESEGKYYPKTPIKNKQSNWSHTLYAGAPVGTQFRLVVISLDNNDNQTILDWFKTGESNGRYPGIETLGSVKELSAIKLVIQ